MELKKLPLVDQQKGTDIAVIINMLVDFLKRYNAVTSVTANYTVNENDWVILGDASGGAFTVTMPAAGGMDMRSFVIKKIDSSVNGVTVDGNGSETIDGDTTKVIGTQYDALEIVSDGTNWNII